MMSITKQKYHPLFFLIGVLILCCQNSNSQVNKTKIIGAYIYNFAKLSSSAKQASLPTYNIVLISDEDEYIEEFKKMETEVSVKNKKIKLTVAPDAKFDFGKASLVFIGADKISYYNQIFENTKAHEILLVTENYSEKSKILLNLYETDEGKILFEINKTNIYDRKILINEEILLMGGTEIDLVELYLNSHRKLVASEEKLAALQTNLEDLHQQINTTIQEIENQKLEVAKHKKEKEKLIGELTNYKIQIKQQKKDYLSSKKKLKTFNDSLIKSQQRLLDYKSRISTGQETLKLQELKIAEKERTLEEKNIIINRQRNMVIIFIIGLILISFLSVLLLINIRDKKRKNILLENQQKEIRSKNKKLTTTLDEIKQIQYQLVQSEKMASLGVLSAGIAHEINNPINFVYAGINSLLKDFEDIEPVISEVSSINLETDNLDEKLKKIQALKEDYYFDEAFEAIPAIINDIKIGADRTAEIVKGLKSFSRADKTEIQSLNIHEGLDTSLLLLKNKYKNCIEIIKNYGENIPLLSCHPGKINQAFLNIISNAIDSISDCGKIWISTSMDKTNIVISIKDNGRGIPEKAIEKLFDPFYTTKPVGQGTGLGLSITYGIIKEHNGTIEVQSAPGKGSEFKIILPIKKKV